MAPSMATIEDLLDRYRREPDVLERQHRIMAVAAIDGLGERQRLDLLNGLGRGRLRVALADRRQVFYPV